MYLDEYLRLKGGNNLLNLIPPEFNTITHKRYVDKNIFITWFKYMEENNKWFRSPQYIPQPELLLHMINNIGIKIEMDRYCYFVLDNYKIKISKQIYFMYVLIKYKIITKDNICYFEAEKSRLKKTIDLTYTIECKDKLYCIPIEFWENHNHEYPDEQCLRIGQLTEYLDEYEEIVNIVIVRDRIFFENEKEICKKFKECINNLHQLTDRRQAKIDYVDKLLKSKMSTIFVDSVSNKNESILELKSVLEQLKVITHSSEIKKRVKEFLLATKPQNQIEEDNIDLTSDVSYDESDDASDDESDDESDDASYLDDDKLSWHGLCRLLHLLNKEDFNNINDYLAIINFTDKIGEACNNAIEEMLDLKENHKKILKFI